MRRIVRYCLLSLFLLLGGSLTSNLHAQFYSLQSNVLKLATTTFHVEGSMLLDKHWTLNMSVSYNPWNFSDTRKIKHFLIEPGVRYWFWQPYAGNFISMYAMGARYNVAWDNLLGGSYRYQGWGYGLGMTYGRSWLLSKRWNLEVEGGLGLLVAPYTKYRCEHCGDKVKSGTYYLPAPKLAVNLIYLF